MKKADRRRAHEHMRVVWCGEARAGGRNSPPHAYFYVPGTAGTLHIPCLMGHRLELTVTEHLGNLSPSN
jgi:hypothetical protein